MNFDLAKIKLMDLNEIKNSLWSNGVQSSRIFHEEYEQMLKLQRKITASNVVSPADMSALIDTQKSVLMTLKSDVLLQALMMVRAVELVKATD